MPAMLSTVSLIDPTTLNPSFSGPDTSRMGRPAVIITRADQQTAVDQFQLLLTNAKAYRLQMLALSKAAASFGYALEKIAHSKASVRDPTNVCMFLIILLAIRPGAAYEEGYKQQEHQQNTQKKG